MQSTFGWSGWPDEGVRRNRSFARGDKLLFGYNIQIDLVSTFD